MTPHIPFVFLSVARNVSFHKSGSKGEDNINFQFIFCLSQKWGPQWQCCEDTWIRISGWITLKPKRIFIAFVCAFVRMSLNGKLTSWWANDLLVAKTPTSNADYLATLIPQLDIGYAIANPLTLLQFWVKKKINRAAALPVRLGSSKYLMCFWWSKNKLYDPPAAQYVSLCGLNLSLYTCLACKSR